MMLSVGIAGCFLGIVITFIRSAWLRSIEVKKAHNVAKDTIKSARNKESLMKEQAFSKIQEYEISLRSQFNKEMDISGGNVHSFHTSKIRSLQSFIDKMDYKNKNQIQDMNEKIQNKKNGLNISQKKLKEKLKIDEDFFQQERQILKQYLEKLHKTFSFDLDSMKRGIQSEFLRKAEEKGRNAVQKISENFEKDLEKNTKRLLEKVIGRFQKACCEERGIRPVVFKSMRIIKIMLENNRSYLDIVETECGVDVVVDQEELSFIVQGLDPVRREWGRLSLEKIEKKNRVNKGIIFNIIKQSKRDLFRKIRKDGNHICNILGLRDVSSNIRNMMGALRYRYSFAQNQHFHCEEVGWLCSLLMAELDDNIDEGKRAGLFHDIGKAMDHAKPGGHAVIGADFIEKHGQKGSIVHAVRAHHNDVSPSNNLDFLVIAADAISGSRPGARRSTVDSYNQKISSMEKIGKGFKGVQDVYVMNAGREVRVIVNSKQINDAQSLEISKKIAQKIEEECSYPGWVKVTVVRKTEVNQIAHAAK